MTWILGLATSKWGLRIIGGLVALILLGFVVHGIWRAGYNAAWRIAEVNTLKQKIATQQDDIRKADDARESAERKSTELQGITDAYQVQLDAAMAKDREKAKAEPGKCRDGIDDDDVGFVRKLRTGK